MRAKSILLRWIDLILSELHAQFVSRVVLAFGFAPESCFPSVSVYDAKDKGREQAIFHSQPFSTSQLSTLSKLKRYFLVLVLVWYDIVSE